jgi:hypothetical protein
MAVLPITISASGRSPNYGRYIEDIVGRLETDGFDIARLSKGREAMPGKLTAHVRPII